MDAKSIAYYDEFDRWISRLEKHFNGGIIPPHVDIYDLEYHFHNQTPLDEVVAELRTKKHPRQ